MSSQVLYSENESVAIITINRPERLNTLTEEVIDGVAASIDRATANDDVSAVVLRGVGKNVSAGSDLDAFLEIVYGF